jgi:hypothetical protein
MQKTAGDEAGGSATRRTFDVRNDNLARTISGVNSASAQNIVVTSSHLDYALSYIACGWAVLPLKRDKTPMLPNGHLGASKDPTQVRQWWTTHPDAGIGIRTGAESDLTVLDEDGEEAGKHLARLVERHPCDMTTGWVVRTGREDGSGRHSYYMGATQQRNCKKQSLDLKSEGGYVVAPPSLHPTGRRYTWERCDGQMPAPLPLALQKLGEIGGSIFEDGNAASTPETPLAGSSNWLARPPEWSEAAQQRVVEAMFVIPAVDYEDWLSVGMVLSWLSETWGDRAFMLWLGWSMTVPELFEKEGGSAGLRKRFATFKRKDGKLRRLGTLFEIAGKYGFKITPKEAAAFADMEIAAMNERHFVLENFSGKCLVGEFTRDSLGDRTLAIQSFGALSDRYANRFVQVVSKNSKDEPVRKRTELGRYWRSHSKRRQYLSVEIDPR